MPTSPGPIGTLAQDLSFAIDQLVEIAIRALSPAVNDTFTAITCVDWLSDGLCKITANWNPRLVHRDGQGCVLIIAADVRYQRFVEGPSTRSVKRREACRRS